MQGPRNDLSSEKYLEFLLEKYTSASCEKVEASDAVGPGEQSAGVPVIAHDGRPCVAQRLRGRY